MCRQRPGRGGCVCGGGCVGWGREGGNVYVTADQKTPRMLVQPRMRCSPTAAAEWCDREVCAAHPCCVNQPAVQAARRRAEPNSRGASAVCQKLASWPAYLSARLPALLPFCLPACCLPARPPGPTLQPPAPAPAPPLLAPTEHACTTPQLPLNPPPRARLPSSSACHILTALSEEHVTNRSL